MDLAVGEQAEPLAEASREKIREALIAISSVMNAVSDHYLRSTTRFDVFPGSGGAVRLLYVLSEGLDADEEWRERLRNGIFDDRSKRHLDL